MGTFDPSVPNAAQSPGLFPNQNNTNYTRLKTIINADHVFNDTAQPTTDGVHKQMTMLARAHPAGPLTDVNGMLYGFVDAQSRTQLWFYNNLIDVQLTPPQELYPIRVVGSATVTAGNTATAYADPGFRYAGSGYGLVDNTNVFGYYSILRSGTPSNTELIEENGSNRPSLLFSGNILQIRNNMSTSQLLTWSLIINRIS